MQQIIKRKQRKEKGININEENIYTWDIHKRNNIQIIGVLEGIEREKKKVLVNEIIF